MKSNSYNARIFYFHKGKQIIVILVLMEIVTGSISQNMFQKVRSNITGIYIYIYLLILFTGICLLIFLFLYSYIFIRAFIFFVFSKLEFY